MPVVTCPKCASRYDPGRDKELADLAGHASFKVICPVCGQWLRLPENEAIEGPRLPPHVLQGMTAQSKLIERGPDSDKLAMAAAPVAASKADPALADMSSSSRNPKSDAAVPLAIKVLGWFLIIASALFVAQILVVGSAFTFPHAAFNFALKGAALAAGVGLLRLKRWAVVLYFAGVIAAIVRMFVWPPTPEVGEFATTASALGLTLLVPAIAAVLVMVYWERFARGVA